MNRETFLAERRKGIGSSDAAAIVGLSPFGNPLSVYLDKLGLLPRDETPEKTWGLRLEQVIADAYTDATGVELITPATQETHPKHSWMIANVDRYTSLPRRIVELKTSRSPQDWGEPGTDQIPRAYLIQTSHQMAVEGADCADVAVLIGGSDFRIYTVPRNEALIERLIQIEAGFWNRVVTQDPPPADWSDPRTPELVALLHRPSEGKVVELGAHSLQLVEEYTLLSEAMGTAEKKKKRIKGMLIEAMGDAECGVLPDLRRITRKEIHRKAYVVAETTYHDFRITNPKE